MAARPHYFKIGLFVIASVFIAAGALVALGAGSIFKEKILFETYLNESVQGLEIGAPVKYRGVQIGNVDGISFAEDVYETKRRYVMVTVNFYPATREGRRKRSEFDERLRGLIQEGLRVRLASQ